MSQTLLMHVTDECVLWQEVFSGNIVVGRQRFILGDSIEIY
jgi:hypothetical protein